MADDITRRIASFIEPFRVTPGSSVTLAQDFDPAFRAGIERKKDGVGLLNDGITLLADLQQRLAAQATHGVVVVLQALDAAGKDGTIRHVMSGVNPQGVRVESFKVPSARELDQDFLRRYQERLPGPRRDRHLQPVPLRGGARRPRASGAPRRRAARGRVRPASRLEAPLRSINEWERYLEGNGFRVVKLFLNLSKEEQRRRFLRRIDLPEHNWKFSSHDLQERRYWDAYQDAFSAMFTHTSTEWAPWYVIPPTASGARGAAAAVIANALIEIDPQYPALGDEARRELEAAKRELEADAPPGAAPDPFEAPARVPAGAGA